MSGRLNRNRICSWEGCSAVHYCPTVPPLPWVGGKRELLPVILPRFPAAYERYIEVFGGGGAALYAKEPTPFEVYNDLNGDLVNLFGCIKYKPLALIRELGFLPLNSREEFSLLLRFLDGEELGDEAGETDIARQYFDEPDAAQLIDILTRRSEARDVLRAAAFFKLNRYSYGSGMTSFGCRPFDLRKSFSLIWAAHRRLAGVVIENKDFEALVRQYDRPGAFFYLDPPYFKAESCYAVEFPAEDHIRLRDLLKGIQGKFLLSYNDDPAIREIYVDFEMFAFTRLNNLAQRYDPGCEYPELLIANYAMDERRHEQLSLYG